MVPQHACMVSFRRMRLCIDGVLMADVVQAACGCPLWRLFQARPFSLIPCNQPACLLLYDSIRAVRWWAGVLQLPVKLEQGLAAQHAVERVVLFLPWLLAHWGVFMHMHTLGLVLTAPMGVAARGSGNLVARNCHSRACMLALPR